MTFIQTGIKPGAHLKRLGVDHSNETPSKRIRTETKVVLSTVDDHEAQLWAHFDDWDWDDIEYIHSRRLKWRY